MKNYSVFSVFLLLLSSCVNNIDYLSSCQKAHNLKGNVERVEVISLTDVPLSEMLAFSSQRYNPIVQCCDGDVIMTFDKANQRLSYQLFDQDGNMIYYINPSFFVASNRGFCPGDLAEPNRASEFFLSEIDICNKDSSDRVIEYTYRDKQTNTVSMRINLAYNEHGDVSQRIAHYGDHINDQSLDAILSDTTTYSYTKYDACGNWTECEQNYVGLMPAHNNSYKIIRRIQYHGDQSGPTSLLSEKRRLMDSNRVSESYKTTNVKLPKVQFKIPEFFKQQTSQQMIDSIKMVNGSWELDNDVYVFNYIDNGYEAFVLVSIMNRPEDAFEQTYDLLPLESLKFDSETDNFFYQTTKEGLKGMSREMLYWKPYEFVKYDNHIALHTHWCRWDDSPWPAEYQSYNFSLPNGYDINFGFLYLTTRTSQMVKYIEEILNTIHFM